MMQEIASEEDGIALEFVHPCGLHPWSIGGFPHIILIEKTKIVF